MDGKAITGDELDESLEVIEMNLGDAALDAASDPYTVAEAMRWPDADHWKEAM